MQQIFIDNEHKMYHWTDNRAVPADNNQSESKLRYLVIARKVSFGSSSDKGTETREILMSVLHTLALRKPNMDIENSIKKLLDKIAKNPSICIKRIFPGARNIIPL